MSGFSDKFTDRQKAANEARKALLDKFKAQPGPDDPAVIARAAERARIAEQARKAEEKRLAEEAALAEMLRIEEEKKAAAAAAEALLAEQKAARDARYAARKLRKRKGS